MKCAAFLLTLVLGAVLRVTAQTSDPAKAAAIIAQMEDLPTSAARFNLLNGRDFVFDFNAGVGVNGGAGGNITIANVADFPYLIGKGLSLTVGRMAPCGLASPHYHPRATEFLYMLTGSNLRVGFLQENGARLVINTLNPGQAAIFPKGSFHYQANTECEPVTFVAGLNSEEPGVATVGQRFFGIQPDVVDVTLGDIGPDEAVRIAKSIPDTFAIGVQSCLDKCKIQRGDQPKSQQQPRGGGNEFPAGKKRSGPGYDDSKLKRSDDAEDRSTPASAISSLISSANVQSLEQLVFSLKLVLGVLLSGYVFVWVYFIVPAWRNRRLQARTPIPPSVPVQDVKA